MKTTPAVKKFRLIFYYILLLTSVVVFPMLKAEVFGENTS